MEVLWNPEEDMILKSYVETHGKGNWADISQRSGLKRGGKSCRLRWNNYLRTNLKRGSMSPQEQDLIIPMHKLLGNRKQSAPESIGATTFTDKPLMSTEVSRSHGEENSVVRNTWMQETNSLDYDVPIGSPLPL